MKSEKDDDFVTSATGADESKDEPDIFQVQMVLETLGDESIQYAEKLIDDRHPLFTLPLVDALPIFRVFSRCCDCVNSRRGSGRAPKRVEDWLKKRAVSR